MLIETPHGDIAWRVEEMNIIIRKETESDIEAISAICDVAKILKFLNDNHKGKFDIPEYLVSDENSWAYF